MNCGRKINTGFTLVELLIVIVVIAILAAISIVAYNGVQDRANDTTVQSDINQLAKKVRLKQAESGEILPGGSRSGSPTNFPGMEFEPSKEAYDTSVNNLIYCEGETDGQAGFAISARSKSGTVFYYSSYNGMENRGKIAHSWKAACTLAGFPNEDQGHTYGYNANQDRWWIWANG